MNANDGIVYLTGSVELLDEVQPLWEQLAQYHASKTKVFTGRYQSFGFERRRRMFIALAQSGKLRVDLAQVHNSSASIKSIQSIGYCVDSIWTKFDRTIGEVESLFVEPAYCGRGIGGQLMRLALEWFEKHKVETRILYVAEGNEDVFDFYRRFGFFKHSTLLEQVRENLAK